MPFNGSGQYSFPSNSFNPAVATTTIDPVAWNADVVDLQTALSLCLLADGTQTALSSIPFAAGITVDTIAEFTAGHGVTVAGVNAKTGNIILTDSSDLTKKITYSMAGITTATTRTWTWPDFSDTFVGLTGAQTLTNKTLTAPVLGAATATSINKVAITAPASSATLTIADGKTLTLSNSITFAGTDSTTMTFPPASASVGYLNVPLNSQIVAYTTVLADAGKCLLHPAADTNARTFTIDSNANVAYPTGTTISFLNETAAVVTIAITTDTLVFASTGGTGSRSLAQWGIATAIKKTSTSWLISGTGIS